jgi:hypothetical protein
MLNTIKAYITELSEYNFDLYYQKYIFDIQDQNIFTEVNSIKTNDILSLDRFIAKLHKELM